MSELLERLNEIEQAVQAGELEQARVQIEALKPQMATQQIDELLALKARIRRLLEHSFAQRAACAEGIHALQDKRRATDAYLEMQGV